MRVRDQRPTMKLTMYDIVTVLSETRDRVQRGNTDVFLPAPPGGTFWGILGEGDLMIFIENGGESVNQNIPIPPPLPPIKKTGSLLFLALFYS